MLRVTSQRKLEDPKDGTPLRSINWEILDGGTDDLTLEPKNRGSDYAETPRRVCYPYFHLTPDPLSFLRVRSSSEPVDGHPRFSPGSLQFGPPRCLVSPF